MTFDLYERVLKLGTASLGAMSVLYLREKREGACVYVSCNHLLTQK